MLQKFLCGCITGVYDYGGVFGISKDFNTAISHESDNPEMCVTDEWSFLRKLIRRTN